MEDNVLAVMKEAALAGAEAISTTAKKCIIVLEKSAHEFVTNCDAESEKAIMRALEAKYPNSGFFSEETGHIKGDGTITWIIDPIDGTHNFMFGMPLYGISIAACKNDKIMAGVIYLPKLNAMYCARQSGGAFLNDKKIKVSDKGSLNRAMVAYDSQFYKHASALPNLARLANVCFTVRIFGSAICDMANVASGALDARIFHNTKRVDFAAGSVIVKEAGGEVTDFKGEEINLNTTDIVVSNGKIHTQLCALLKQNE